MKRYTTISGSTYFEDAAGNEHTVQYSVNYYPEVFDRETGFTDKASVTLNTVELNGRPFNHDYNCIRDFYGAMVTLEELILEDCETLCND